LTRAHEFTQPPTQCARCETIRTPLTCGVTSMHIDETATGSTKLSRVCQIASCTTCPSVDTRADEPRSRHTALRGDDAEGSPTPEDARCPRLRALTTQTGSPPMARDTFERRAACGGRDLSRTSGPPWVARPRIVLTTAHAFDRIHKCGISALPEPARRATSGGSVSVFREGSVKQLHSPRDRTTCDMHASPPGSTRACLRPTSPNGQGTALTCC
jgi:hypothetical protein